MLIVVGILLMVAGVIYLTTTAGHLPSFFPGHSAGSTAAGAHNAHQARPGGHRTGRRGVDRRLVHDGAIMRPALDGRPRRRTLRLIGQGIACSTRGSSHAAAHTAPGPV